MKDDKEIKPYTYKVLTYTYKGHQNSHVQFMYNVGTQ